MGCFLSAQRPPARDVRRGRPDSLPHLELQPFEPGQPCTVCYESSVEFPPAPPTSQCLHPTNICALCLEKYVCARVNDGVMKMACPSMSCRRYMSDRDIQTAVASRNKVAFEKFCEQKLLFSLQTEPNLVWCKAPACGSAQIHTGGADCPVVICHACSEQVCFTHDTFWHDGQTCAEFDEELKLLPKRVRENKKSQRWIKNKTKPCPGEGCGRPIQKNKGCDHMVCQQPAGCGHEFCWRCLAPYGPILQQGNTLHGRTCRHHG